MAGNEPGLGGQSSADEPRLGGHNHILHMVEMIEHDDPAVRTRALFGLATVGDERAVEGLIALLEGGDPRTQERVIFALGTMGKDHIDRAVVWVLEQVPPRYGAFYGRYGPSHLEQALISLGKPVIRPLLLQFNHDEAWRREQAYALLECLPYDEVIAVAESLLAAPSQVVQQAARHALDRL